MNEEDSTPVQDAMGRWPSLKTQ